MIAVPKRDRKAIQKALREGLVGIVCLAVVGVLGALLIVPRVIGRTENSKVRAARSDEASIKSALDTFRQDCGRYPTDDEGLQALVTAPSGLEGKWRSAYLSALPVDPWQNSYLYHSSGPESFTIDCPATSDHRDVNDGE